MRVAMTILVKANTAGKKAAGVAVLPLVGQRQVKRIHMHARYGRRLRPSIGTFLLMSLVTLVVVILGFISGVLLFHEYVKANIRYRGFCAISSTKDTDYIVLNDKPVKPFMDPPAAQMKVYSSASDLINSRIMNQLLEDMAIEDRMETITVHDGERAFEIVHDFDDNLTSIRSVERCFLMDMCRDYVLDPTSLIAGFHNESKLDLSHAHTFFRAELPALSVAVLSNVGLAKTCIKSNRPIYRLYLEDTLILRKRSIVVGAGEPLALELESSTTTAAVTATPEAPTAPVASEASTDSATPASLAGPSQDFVHFSGKHLQRITISNMGAVLRYEREAPPTGAPGSSGPQRVHPKLQAAAVSQQ